MMQPVKRGRTSRIPARSGRASEVATTAPSASSVSVSTPQRTAKRYDLYPSITKDTVLVASPSAIGRPPGASGSRVPAWPALGPPQARLTTDTAWVDVMPIGLSRISQPLTLRFSRRRCAGAPSGGFAGESLIVIGRLEVAADCRRSQKLLDSFRLVESLVHAEADVGCEFQVNATRDLAAQEFPVAVEGGEHLLLVAAAERHDVDGGLPQVRAHPLFRHRDQVRLDHRTVHLAAGKNFRQRVTHQLASAQLALRRT